MQWIVSIKNYFIADWVVNMSYLSREKNHNIKKESPMQFVIRSSFIIRTTPMKLGAHGNDEKNIYIYKN